MKISWNNIKRFLAGASIALVLGGCSPKSNLSNIENTITVEPETSITEKNILDTINEFTNQLQEENKLDIFLTFFGDEELTPVTEDMKLLFQQKGIPQEYLMIPYVTNMVEKAMENNQKDKITYLITNDCHRLEIVLEDNENGEDNKGGTSYMVEYELISPNSKVFRITKWMGSRMKTINRHSEHGFQSIQDAMVTTSCVSCPSKSNTQEIHFWERVYGEEKVGFDRYDKDHHEYSSLDMEYIEKNYDLNDMIRTEVKIDANEYETLKQEATQFQSVNKHEKSF